MLTLWLASGYHHHNTHTHTETFRHWLIEIVDPTTAAPWRSDADDQDQDFLMRLSI